MVLVSGPFDNQTSLFRCFKNSQNDFIAGFLVSRFISYPGIYSLNPWKKSLVQNHLKIPRVSKPKYKQYH